MTQNQKEENPQYSSSCDIIIKNEIFPNLFNKGRFKNFRKNQKSGSTIVAELRGSSFFRHRMKECMFQAR